MFFDLLVCDVLIRAEVSRILILIIRACAASNDCDGHLEKLFIVRGVNCLSPTITGEALAEITLSLAAGKV